MLRWVLSNLCLPHTFCGWKKSARNIPYLSSDFVFSPTAPMGPNPSTPLTQPTKSQDATGDDWDTSAESFRGYTQTTLRNMAKWWGFLLVMVIYTFYEAQGSPIRVK